MMLITVAMGYIGVSNIFVNKQIKSKKVAKILCFVGFVLSLQAYFSEMLYSTTIKIRQ